MVDTLHIDLGQVLGIARTQSQAAEALSAIATRLRLRVPSPATDPTSLELSSLIQCQRLRLAAVTESAADELTRVLEVILLYANNARLISERTQLALMGLDIPMFEPEPLTAVTPRRVAREPADSHPLDGSALSKDSEILSAAVLLAAGCADISWVRARVASLDQAARVLNDGASQLTQALSSGERPAAMLMRFSSWISTALIPAITAIDDSIQAWSTAYLQAREAAAGPAAIYRQWLVDARAGRPEPAELAAQARCARQLFDAYRSVPIDAIVVEPFPRLGAAGE